MSVVSVWITAPSFPICEIAANKFLLSSVESLGPLRFFARLTFRSPSVRRCAVVLKPPAVPHAVMVRRDRQHAAMTAPPHDATRPPTAAEPSSPRSLPRLPLLSLCAAAASLLPSAVVAAAASSSSRRCCCRRRCAVPPLLSLAVAVHSRRCCCLLPLCSSAVQQDV